DLEVALLFLHGRIEVEKLMDEALKLQHHVRIFLGDAETQPLRVEGAIPHEVTDQFRELWRHRAWDLDETVVGPVEFAERWQLHVSWLANQSAHGQRDDVSGGNVGKALPLPLPRDVVDDTDSVLESALNFVAARRRDFARVRYSIDVETRCLPRAL